MSDVTATIGRAKPVYASREQSVATNAVQEIIIAPETARDYMLASERSLMSIWMTPEEDEAWKDL
jgi:hypothetical protein